MSTSLGQGDSQVGKKILANIHSIPFVRSSGWRRREGGCRGEGEREKVGKEGGQECDKITYILITDGI